MSEPASLSEFEHPSDGPFAAAARQFVAVALRGSDSLFTPGQPIWTQETIADLQQRFTADPASADAPFLDTLARQLADAPAATCQLAAELLYVHLLVVTGILGGEAKRSLIRSVANLSPEPAALPPPLDEALDQGVARAGTSFLTNRVLHLQFLLEFVRHWKSLPAEEQAQALADPWQFKIVLFSLPVHRAHAQREALLHLVHPDTFAPVISREHKRRIARTHDRFVREPTDDIDQQLLQIRQNYTRQYGHPPDFYQREQPAAASPHSPPSPLPRSLGPDLRAYTRLAMQLDAPAYTPAQLAEQAGRISPPVIDPAAPPDSQRLVRDLLRLRLLEPSGDGSYRRWPHLDGATPEHLLRYVALTLLVPTQGATGTHETAGKDFHLPLLNAPFDGRVHPVVACPYGEALLSWYVEAGLAQRNADGTWQSLPAALEPLPADTPLAQAINTFLYHLRRVRASLRDLPPLADDALPLLDPAVLEQRISELQRDLLIDRTTILRIYRALIAGHHIILSGPPGTGKTHLARLLPQVLWRDAQETVVLHMPTDPALPPTASPTEQRLARAGYAVELVTATEDWGVRHVIGGIVPQLAPNASSAPGLAYTVRHGCLTRAVLANYGCSDGDTLPPVNTLRRQEITDDSGQRYRGRWLVIDEFTRAPIDAAFGSLLTTLGGQRSPLLVPTASGDELPIPLPRDFRIIGTLNSFDRHFLNQMSEAMKRRFAFIDVLPPAREHAAAEQAMAVYRALLRLSVQGLPDISIDHERGRAVWEELLTVVRDEPTTAADPTNPAGSERGMQPYRLEIEDPQAAEALASFWRIFSAIRVYRLLGTAQAEATCSALLTGRSIGMNWREALDSALADTLVDQVQVLARDEQRVLLAFIEHAAQPERFTERCQQLLSLLPVSRQMAHLSQLRAVDMAEMADMADMAGVPDESPDELPADPIDDIDPSRLTPAQAARLFDLGTPLLISAGGLFAHRLRAFIRERGL